MIFVTCGIVTTSAADADRCGKGTNIVCADCVVSGFTDIWSCGACAWCLGF